MKTIKVEASIIHQNGKILATQRGYGDFKGLWEFPGGRIEPGETPEEALCREIQEELGVTISVESHICTIDYDYTNFHLTMHCYWCRSCKVNWCLMNINRPVGCRNRSGRV